MRILVTGSTGLIGSALVPFLTSQGHEIIRLVRSKPKPGSNEFQWDPLAGVIDPAALTGIDVVIHLAGENIAGRWTAEKKARIRDSRVKGTQTLCKTLIQMTQPPRVGVFASAVGYYGNRGDEILREESPPGSGFLAEVCREWEAATEPAAQKGIRVVRLRIGIVLSPAGGALAAMLPAFKIGAGGPIGGGKQYVSWITLDDLTMVIDHVIKTETLQGPVNAVTPNPVTNAEFTKTLGKVLGRPTALPMPAFAARLAFGEMANELLLASTRVEPARLLASGYTFRYPHLEGALRHLLGN